MKSAMLMVFVLVRHGAVQKWKGECEMTQIHDGIRYDTSKAVAVAEWSNQYDTGNFKWARETLYRTTNGRYFLHGKGGPLSCWAEKCGDMVCEGEGIRPLEVPALAVEWLGGRGLDIPDNCPELVAEVVEA